MKKVFLTTALALLFIFSNVYSQSLFWDIEFKDSPQIVKSKVLSKKGIKLNSKVSTKDKLIFENGEFLGYDINTVYFYFHEEQFYNVLFSLKPYFSNYDVLMSNYEKVVSYLSEKYFKPDRSTREFYSPYYEGDGYELTSIRTENTTINDIWFLVDEHTTIITTLYTDGYNIEILLSFIYKPIDDVVKKIKENKNKSDLD